MGRATTKRGERKKTRIHESLGRFCVQINLITFGNTDLLCFTFNPIDPITFPTKQRIKLIFNF